MIKDLTGKKFGLLTIVEQTDKRIRGGVVWVCRCDCGNTIEVVSGRLQEGRTKHCGCLKKDIFFSKHPLYKIWKGMIARCYNPRSTGYKNYGGRGIRVCDEWKNSIATFISDMEPRLSKDHSLDRINNDGPYNKKNCRWSTPKEQLENTRYNRMITTDGETLCLTAWARKTGIPITTIVNRLKRGWSEHDAVHAPPRKVNSNGS